MTAAAPAGAAMESDLVLGVNAECQPLSGTGSQPHLVSFQP